jgi:hypothetical protein
MLFRKALLLFLSFWILTVHTIAQTSQQAVSFTNNSKEKVWAYVYHEGCFESAIPALCYNSELDAGQEVSYTPPDIIRNWDTFKEVFQFVGDALMIVAGLVITVVTAGAGAEVEAGAIAETVATTGAEAGLDAVDAAEAIETAAETTEMSIETTSEVATEFPEVFSAAEEGGDAAADMGSEALTQMEGQTEDLAEDATDAADADQNEDGSNSDSDSDSSDDSADDQSDDGNTDNEDEEEEEDDDDCNSNSSSASQNLTKAKNAISKAKSLYKNIKAKIPDPMKETFKELRSQYQFVKGPAEKLYAKVLSDDGDDDSEHPIDYESDAPPTDDMACELKALNKIAKDAKKLEDTGFKLIKDLAKEDRQKVSHLYSLVHMGLGLPVPIQTWSKNREWAYVVESEGALYTAKAGHISLDGNTFELIWYPPGDTASNHDVYWAKYAGPTYPAGTYYKGNTQPLPQVEHLQESYTVDNNNLISVNKVARTNKTIQFSLKTNDNVTWWKGIQVFYHTRDGSIKSQIIQTQGDAHQVWGDVIDLSVVDPYPPLTVQFWKAKAFGVHTQVGSDTYSIEDIVNKDGNGNTVVFFWEND